MVESHEGVIPLNQSFDKAYRWLKRLGPKNLVTGKGTQFVASADVVSKGDRIGENVIRFFQKKREFGRAYECCWGYYHNCNRTRIGMYCGALDSAISSD